MFGKCKGKSKSETKEKGQAGMPAKVLTLSGHREEVDRSIAAPELVVVEKGRLTVNGKIVIPCQVVAYPARVYEGWIADEFVWKPYLLDFVQFIEPMGEEKIVNELNRRITRLEAKLQEMHEKGRTDTTSLEQELQHLYGYRERLISRQTRLYTISTYFYVLADDREAAEDFFSDFNKRMKAKGCQLKRIRYRMLDAFRMLLPEGRDLLRRKILVDSDAVVSCFPFTFPTLMHESGVLYGFDAATRAPLLLDRFKFAGHNEIVVGKIGSGKSFFVKLEVIRWVLNDPEIKIFLVDPLAGFRDVAAVLGAQRVIVGRNIMNPLDIFVRPGETPQSALKEKLISLIEFFSTFFEEEIGNSMDKAESGVLRKAIIEAYADKNFQDVIIDDVIERVEKVAVGEEEKRAAERIKSAMSAFTAELSMFNGPTDVDVSDRVVYFDFSAVEGVEKSPLPLHAVLTWIGSRVRAESGKKIVVIDEAHYFMAYRQIRRFLEREIRHSRHHSTGYSLITQGYDEFIRFEEGRTMISNADIHVIFRLEVIPEEIKRRLDIPASGENFVKEAVQGKTAGYSSALLVTPSGIFHMNVVALPEEVAYLGIAGRGV